MRCPPDGMHAGRAEGDIAMETGPECRGLPPREKETFVTESTDLTSGTDQNSEQNQGTGLLDLLGHLDIALGDGAAALMRLDGVDQQRLAHAASPGDGLPPREKETFVTESTDLTSGTDQNSEQNQGTGLSGLKLAQLQALAAQLGITGAPWALAAARCAVFSIFSATSTSRSATAPPR
jgi:hypothetical protein